MTKFETLQILDNYRINLNSKLNDPGWTKWALVGSFVTLFWLLLDIIDNHVITWPAVIKISVAIYLVSPLFQALLISNRSEIVNSSDKSYFIIQSEIFKSRHSLVYQVLVLVVIAYHINSSDFFNQYYLSLFNFYLGSSLLAILILVVLSRYLSQSIGDVHYSLDNRYSRIWNMPIQVVFRWIIPIVLVCGISIDIYDKGDVSILSFQLSLIIFGLYYLVLLWLSVSINKPVIDSIDQIIVDLTFDKIDSETAMDKLKFLVFGISFGDILRTDLGHFRNSHEDFGLLCNKMNAKLNLISSSNDSNDEKVRNEALVDSFVKDFKNLRLLVGSIKGDYKRIRFKLHFFSDVDLREAEFREFINELSEMVSKNEDDLKSVEEKVQALKLELL
ncbi:hypothetical protein [Marinoscillum pacificum]|uniref:hypothetical protein n=1 Tax=Marinoscillum pacificum TaxID=392723 RepID=UPI0021572B28|nr:hypothetical protein [Marinoscillum pacificum]